MPKIYIQPTFQLSQARCSKKPLLRQIHLLICLCSKRSISDALKLLIINYDGIRVTTPPIISSFSLNRRAVKQYASELASVQIKFHPQAYIQIMQSFHSYPETREWGESVPHPAAPFPLHPSSFSPFPQPLPPTLPKIEYLQLSRRERELETAIQDAKAEQAMMLELFNSMALLQQGEQKRLKKCKRRCPEEIVERHNCPHQNCTRFYASDSALRRHVRLKHDQLGDDPPERYHTLHPEPDLAGQSFFNEGESQDQQNQDSLRQKPAKKQVYASIEVKCK